jgi:hypothetical protein
MGWTDRRLPEAVVVIDPVWWPGRYGGGLEIVVDRRMKG